MGTRWCQSVNFSNAAPTLRTVVSSYGCPVIIIPIGMPPLVNPQGTECDGCPVTSKILVNMGSRFPASIFPFVELHSVIIGV